MSNPGNVILLGCSFHLTLNTYVQTCSLKVYKIGTTFLWQFPKRLMG